MKKMKPYDLVYKNANRKNIDTRWVFRINKNEKGEILKNKALWVVNGYMKQHGVGYNLTHEPAPIVPTLVLLSLEVKLKIKINQMDLSTAFFRTAFNDVIYIRPLSGLEHLVTPVKTLTLLKALYGLRQSSRVWNELLNCFLKEEANMKTTAADRYLYTH